MKEELEALHAGRITWDKFTRATDAEWTRLAAKMVRRYRLPAAVSLDDVKQEMLVAAWRHVVPSVAGSPNPQAWREDGGQPLHRYVVIGACNQANSWLNRQRNSRRRSHGAPSRIPVLVDDLVPAEHRGDSPAWDAVASVEGEQESALLAAADAVARRVKFEAARARAEARATSREWRRRIRHCAHALLEAEFNEERAAEALLRNGRSRRACGIETEREARLALRSACEMLKA